MTRYCLQHRDTGHVWPLPAEHPTGFPYALSAVTWADANKIPLAYTFVPFPESERAQPARLSGEP